MIFTFISESNYFWIFTGTATLAAVFLILTIVQYIKSQQFINKTKDEGYLADLSKKIYNKNENLSFSDQINKSKTYLGKKSSDAKQYSKFFGVLFLLSIIFGAYLLLNDPGDDFTVVNIENLELNDSTASLIAEEILQTKPAFTLYNTVNDLNYIVAFVPQQTGKEIQVLIEKDRKWSNSFNYSFSEFADGSVRFGEKDENWEIVDLDNRPFLYFPFKSTGNNAGTIYFILLSLSEKRIYEESVSGNFADVKGQQLIEKEKTALNENVKNDTAVAAFLEEKIKSSGLFIETTSESVDVKDYSKSIINWQIQNKKLFQDDSIGLSIGEKVSVKFTPYQQNLFKSTNASESSTIENESFIVKSFFKGPVIAFDKNSSSYFILWADDNFWDTHIISFSERNSQIINIENYSYTLEVDIQNKTIKRVL